MTDRLTPEQIAQRISGELAAITEACPQPPRCYICADCEVKLEEAIAAALAAQDAEIATLKAFANRMAITFRNYYAQAVPRSHVEDIMEEWTQLQAGDRSEP